MEITLLQNQLINSRGEQEDFKDLLSRILSNENALLKARLQAAAPLDEGLMQSKSFYKAQHAQAVDKIKGLYEKLLHNQHTIHALEEALHEAHRTALQH